MYRKSCTGNASEITVGKGNIRIMNNILIVTMLFFVKGSLGIQIEVRKDGLDEQNKDSSDEAIRVTLLADLQQMQDNEAQNMITNLESKVTYEC